MRLSLPSGLALVCFVGGAGLIEAQPESCIPEGLDSGPGKQNGCPRLRSTTPVSVGSLISASLHYSPDDRALNVGLGGRLGICICDTLRKIGGKFPIVATTQGT